MKRKNLYDINLIEEYIERDKANYSPVIWGVCLVIFFGSLAFYYVAENNEINKLEDQVESTNARITVLEEELYSTGDSDKAILAKNKETFVSKYNIFSGKLDVANTEIETRIITEIGEAAPSDLFFREIRFQTDYVLLVGVCEETDAVAQMIYNLRHIEGIDEAFSPKVSYTYQASGEEGDFKNGYYEFVVTAALSEDKTTLSTDETALSTNTEN